MPLLYDKKVEWQNVAYTCDQGCYGLVTDQYRFTKTTTGKYHLYDLKKDHFEWENLVYENKYKNLVKEFESKILKVKWNKP